MAVANTKSSAVTNDDSSQPRVLNPTYLAATDTKVSVGTCEVAAADDNASVYRMVRVPSSAIIFRLEVLNDAIAGGSSYDLGAYKVAANGGAVVDADLWASAIDMTVARSLPLDASFEALDIVNIEKRLWELLGLTADPFIEYDICFTANTVGTAAGTLSLRAVWGM